MKKYNNEIEPLAVRRAKIMDHEMVRYRVYRAPETFVTVIAENALMAVKVSGIKKPYKILRDWPTEGIAVDAIKMQAADGAEEKVAFPTVQAEDKHYQLGDVLSQAEAPKAQSFQPLSLADLGKQKPPRARVLSPEMLSEILEQHQRAQATAVVPLPPMEVTVAPEPMPSSTHQEKELSFDEIEKLLKS